MDVESGPSSQIALVLKRFFFSLLLCSPCPVLRRQLEGCWIAPGWLSVPSPCCSSLSTHWRLWCVGAKVKLENLFLQVTRELAGPCWDLITQVLFAETFRMNPEISVVSFIYCFDIRLLDWILDSYTLTYTVSTYGVCILQLIRGAGWTGCCPLCWYGCLMAFW